MPINHPRIQPDWASVGYGALTQRYDLRPLSHFPRSFVSQRGQRRTFVEPDRTIEVYPKQYAIGAGFGEHLEFALKHEGIDLEILSLLFHKVDPAELTLFIKSKPTGKHARRLWYLYEFLTGRMLDLDDLKKFTRYDPLLDEAQYFTAERWSSPRHKIADNLLGNRLFCPIIRRTPQLEKSIAARLDERCREVLREFPEAVLRRALDYLFTKETRSSFEIEHLKPDSSRTARFVSLLKRAGTDRFLNKDALLRLQQATVDQRFANRDWRADQNYIGLTRGCGKEDIHYISPKPEDVAGLMEGLFDSARRMLEARVHPVLIAGAIAFGFVFVHPFDDGNGRLHRFLIHHILAQTGFTPEGVIFPVSATMVRRRAKYDSLLESFSIPLLPLVHYVMDEREMMSVLNDTAVHYRYPEMTEITAGLFEFIQETVETELPAEMRFLVNYDHTKRAMQEIVDMPDHLIDLFIKICHQHQGHISKAKRESLFTALTDNEVERMENAYREVFAEDRK